MDCDKLRIGLCPRWSNPYTMGFCRLIGVVARSTKQKAMKTPQTLAAGLQWMGILLILFAISDLVMSRIFSVEITSVWWTPLVAGVAGGLLIKFFTYGD